MKFRKKPIVVEASQWFPPGDERYNSIAHPVGCDPGAARVGTIVKQPWDNMGGVAYSIRILEGWCKLTAGDWVIQGVAGEFHSCKSDITFKATYEPVE
jgi:hypothetical protein